MKDLTLVIMAAGMGSRFGGPKQIEPIGPSGEFIIDYSIYDAIRCGFNKVVIIIKEEHKDIFEDTIGKRIKNKVKIEYAFQKNDDVPKFVKLPKERIKPFGTGHAIYSARDNINENFVIINSDDFYGKESFEQASKYFNNNTGDENEYLLVAYKTKNTLPASGSVKRGICKVSGNYLETIIESIINKEEGKLTASPLSGASKMSLTGDEIVSMNMLGFPKTFINHLEKDIELFFKNNSDDLNDVEYLIPNIVDEQIKNNLAKVKVIKTNSVWLGVTYKEDKEIVVKEIQELINKNIYPENLWN